MFLFLLGSIVLTIVVLIVLTMKSHNIFGRMLAVNVLGTLVAILMAIIGVITNQSDYLDIALLYILLNFSTTLALLRFFKSGKIPQRLLEGVSLTPFAANILPDQISDPKENRR